MEIQAREQYNNYISSLAVATRLMNLEIKKSIVDKKVIDSTYMKNTTIIHIVLNPSDKRPMSIEIDTTEYYKYMDGGTGIFGPRNQRIPVESIPGMAYYLKGWAKRKGINPWAVATAIVQKGGLKPRDITKYFMSQMKFKEQMNNVNRKWAVWRAMEK